MRFILSGIIFVFALEGAWAAEVDLSKAIQFEVEKYQLKNGLTVLLQEDHSVPLVSVHQWFRVGSKDELPKKTGLAHFFEHMMFKGTKKFPKEVFAQSLTEKGGEFNAFTTSDYTGYYITLPKDHLNLVLEIESDRMRNLLLAENDVVSEREVVKEERRMRYDNVPEGVMRETLSSMIYTTLPYRFSVIGSMEDLNQASMEDLRAFYKRYYSPNNAVLVIVGDFSSAEVKKMIEKLYGSLPSEEIERLKFKPEVEPTKPKKTVIKKNIQAPIISSGYLTQPIDHRDQYALEILMAILTRGDSSRLQKKLVYEDQLVDNAAAGCQAEVLGGSCLFFAYLKPTVKPETVLRILDQQLQSLATKKISDKELEKAKNNYMMDYVNSLKKVNGRAQSLAFNEIQLGDYKKLFTDLAEIQAVTSDQVMAVTKKYFKKNRENVVILLPESADGKDTPKAKNKGGVK